MEEGAVVIIGGTSGICRRLAEVYASNGRRVVISGRDLERTSAVAASVAGPGTVSACAVDLSSPEDISVCLGGVGAVDRDENSVKDYDVARAIRLVTLKLVGYTEVVHSLLERLTPNASILL